MSSVKSKVEDEAVVDRGAAFVKHICDEGEVEGHHTVYIGVHVPKSYHRRRRHRRKSSHKEKRERAEHATEGYKSDGENDSSACILKPLRKRYSYTFGKNRNPPLEKASSDSLVSADNKFN